MYKGSILGAKVIFVQFVSSVVTFTNMLEQTGIPIEDQINLFAPQRGESARQIVLFSGSGVVRVEYMPIHK